MNCTRICIVLFVLTALVVGPAARATDHEADPIRLLVVTGDHPYDHEPFIEMFEGHDDIVFHHVDLVDKGEIFDDVSDWSFDAMLLYNMSNPMSGDPAVAQRRYANFIELLERGVGLIPMHHGLLSYLEWPERTEIYGCVFGADGPFGFYLNQEVSIHIENPTHPITQGMEDFTVIDEMYTNYYGPERPSNELLLTTKHEPADGPIAWARHYANARVFSFQLGHDALSFRNPNVIRLVAQGTRWVAGRLPEEAGGQALENTTIFREQNPKWAFEAIGQYERGQSRSALDYVHKQVEASLGDPDARDALAARLASRLHEDVTDDCKRFVFRELTLLRSDEQLQTVASFLTDPAWSDYARYTVEGYANAAAAQAIRDVVETATPTLLPGLINSIGSLRDEEAIDRLAEMATNDRADIREAALSALGRIATRKAEKTLAALPQDEKTAWARLRIADRWLQAGKSRRAAKVYGAVRLEASELAVEAASVTGLLRTRKDRGLLADMLTSGAAHLEQAALAALPMMDDARTTARVASLLPELSPPLQVEVIHALADRGDVAAREAVEALVASSDRAVHIAATERLGDLGDAGSVALLMQVATDEEDEDSWRAFEALKILDADGVDAALTPYLKADEPAMVHTAVRLVAQRQAAGAFEALVPLVNHEEQPVRIQVFSSLGIVTGTDRFDELTRLAASAQDKKTARAAGEAIQTAAEFIGEREYCVEVLIATFGRATPAGRSALVRAMSQMPCEASRGFLVASARHQDQSVRTLAIEGLAEWPNAAVLDDLWALAREAQRAENRQTALHGYVRIVRDSPEMSDREKLGRLRASYEATDHDKTRALVLRGVADLPLSEALDMALAHIEEESVQKSAIDAVIMLAEELALDYPDRVTEAIAAVREASRDPFWVARTTQLEETIQEFTERLLKQWTFNEDDGAWEAANDCSASVADGVLTVEIDGDDPFIIADGLNIAGGNRIIKLRGRFDTEGIGQFFWKTDKHPEYGAPSMMAVFEFGPRDGQWREYQIPVAVDGTMTSLRLDPGWKQGQACIDNIRVFEND